MNKKVTRGELLGGKLLNSFNLHPLNRVWLITLPISAGILATVMHAGFHWPLKLPGHHMEWIAILLFVRYLSPLKFAASLTALGATVATLVPVMGNHSISSSLCYLAAGILMDYGFRIHWVRTNFISLVMLAATAHASKPVLHWVMMKFFGIPAGSLTNGFSYPYFSHLLFGFTGGTIGLAFALLTKRQLKKT